MLPEYVKYYYLKLPKHQQDVYMQLYQGFRAHLPAIEVKTDPSKISTDDLLYIFRCLYNDTPSFYFLEVAGIYRIVTLTTGYILSVNYQYTEDQIRVFDKDLNQGLTRFRQRYIRDGMTDHEKEMAIHDFLVMTVTYDYESAQNEAQMRMHGEIFNVIGALLRKKAVCWGIACAFKLLCDACGVKCFVVIGDALHGEPGGAGHAWNIVRLDEKNYHVDVTWDIKKKGDISCIYDYFNLNDALIRLDHTWDDTIYPTCDALTYNYYRKNQLYVKAPDQVHKCVRRHVLDGKRYITFKYIGDLPSNEALYRGIARGIQRARKWLIFPVYRGGYAIQINRETHNVYVDLLKKK